MGSEVVFCLVAHVHDYSLLPIPIRRNRAILAVHFNVLLDVRKHVITSVLFVRWFLDIEQLQTHHIRQFLVTFKRCRVTNIRVQTL